MNLMLVHLGVEELRNLSIEVICTNTSRPIGHLGLVECYTTKVNKMKCFCIVHSVPCRMPSTYVGLHSISGISIDINWRVKYDLNWCLTSV